MINEKTFLFNSFLLGIYITFVYDIIRILRRVFRHGNFWLSVEDLAFWIFCGDEVFLLMHRESNGILRWYAVVGALLGMLLYRKLISRFFVKYVSKGLIKIKNLTIHILKWLWKPFAMVCHALKNKLTYILKVLKMNLKK